ncbi:MAG: GNAT family N-acetyltransferase [Thermomicrobiaceae bacterium]
MTAIDHMRHHRPDSEDRPLVTRAIHTSDEMEAVYHIRREVFVREQGLTRSVYDEPDDRVSVHVIAQSSGQIIGAGRLTFIRDEGQIAWLAVLKSARRTGAGQAIMDHLMSIAAEKPVQYVTLNAQTHALRFYERFGFESLGRRFHMNQIEHQYMVKQLDAAQS